MAKKCQKRDTWEAKNPPKKVRGVAWSQLPPKTPKKCPKTQGRKAQNAKNPPSKNRKKLGGQRPKTPKNPKKAPNLAPEGPWLRQFIMKSQRALRRAPRGQPALAKWPNVSTFDVTTQATAENNYDGKGLFCQKRARARKWGWRLGST